MQAQSGIGKTHRNEQINPIYGAVLEKVGKNEFHGYEKTEVESAKVISLVKNDAQVEQLNEGDEGLIVLDHTPFYAESGGQVGDTGELIGYGSVASVSADASPGASENALANASATDKTGPVELKSSILFRLSPA